MHASRRRVISNVSHWMLKTTAHRGQGLRLVTSEEARSVVSSQ